jgi:WD40 repeat protein
LEGHTETVEFLEYNMDGKYLCTAGMNNKLRVWDVEKNYSLKCTIEETPEEDINFIKWHPKGNVVLCGARDFSLWMFNGINGEYMACFTGHEEDVLAGDFTRNNDGKQVISTSADCSIRLWSPAKHTCLQVTKHAHSFHQAGINCFALHHEKPIIVSGDLDGDVYLSTYTTGETHGKLASH